MEDIPMSTRIDDLPGPSEIIDTDPRNFMETQMPQLRPQGLQGPPVLQQSQPISQPLQQDTDTTKNMNYLTYLKSEINEENILLLTVLFLSTVRDYEYLLYKLLGNNMVESRIIFNILKVLLLFLIYKLFKVYVLTKIRV